MASQQDFFSSNEYASDVGIPCLPSDRQAEWRRTKKYCPPGFIAYGMKWGKGGRVTRFGPLIPNRSQELTTRAIGRPRLITTELPAVSRSANMPTPIVVDSITQPQLVDGQAIAFVYSATILIKSVTDLPSLAATIGSIGTSSDNGKTVYTPTLKNTQVAVNKVVKQGTKSDIYSCTVEVVTADTTATSFTLKVDVNVEGFELVSNEFTVTIGA